VKRLIALLGLLISCSAFGANYIGDYQPGDTVDCNFGTVNPSTGASFTLAGTPAISVYKDNGTTESTTGVTLTADFDARTGFNHIRVTTGSDGTFYSAGSFFEAVITTGTVNSISVVGQPVCAFSLAKTSALRPTTAGRTLLVDASGNGNANLVNIAGSAVSTSTAQLGVNIVNHGGTAVAPASCTGAIPTLGIIDCGTAQAVTATTLQLRSAANFDTNDEIVGATCVITTATTGAGQSRTVTAYTNSTDTATVATWTTTPTGTITYMCYGTSSSSGSVSIAANGITASSYATGAAPLMPTVAGRTLDVSATGEAGMDWANIGSPTTTVNLSGTSISTSQAVASVSGAVGSVTGAVGSVTGNVGGTVNGLTATAQGNVRTAVGLASANLDTQLSGVPTAVWAVTATQPSAKPVWATSTIKQILEWMSAWSVNKVKQTATTKTLRNTGDTADLETCTVSDDGTTFTLGACSP
jgi:hypothetical protein